MWIGREAEKKLKPIKMQYKSSHRIVYSSKTTRITFKNRAPSCACKSISIKCTCMEKKLSSLDDFDGKSFKLFRFKLHTLDGMKLRF